MFGYNLKGRCAALDLVIWNRSSSHYGRALSRMHGWEAGAERMNGVALMNGAYSEGSPFCQAV
jgi:hypothetical protein